MVGKSWSTSSGARTGTRKSRRASSPRSLITDSPKKATSASREIIPARSSCATFGSASCREGRAIGRDDVPPVLHLGGVVRDDGDVSRPNLALQRPGNWTGLWSDCYRCAGFALRYRHRRRPLVRERKAACGTAPYRRRSDVGRLEANNICSILPAADSLCRLLH